MTKAVEKRKKIYSKSVTGKWRSLRNVVNSVLLGIYFILPWIKLNGRQALLFDIPARKFYIFNLVIWPQEVFYLTFVTLFLAICLFFITALAGRVWCGYACPQTVFTDIFMSIESLIEGDRNSRIKLDNSSWGATKTFKKGLTLTVWIAFSFAVSFTFVSYFSPPEVLIERMATGNLTAANSFWLVFLTGTTYAFCAFLRELICMVPCPYGRFQSALMDKDTLIIGYDTRRGEPRGRLKSDKRAPDALGDCVDCSLCVQVCPTGIDIRNGLQCECIGCAQCIDACDTVMGRVGRPEGLIRYGSLDSFAGGGIRILRPRVAVYAAIIALLISSFTYKLSTRMPLDIDVLRNRSSLFDKTTDGRVINVYTIKAMNMDNQDHQYILKVEGIPAQLVVGNNPISVKGGEIYQTSLYLIAGDRTLSKRVNHLTFVIEDKDNPKVSARRESTFLIPEDAIKVSSL